MKRLCLVVVLLSAASASASDNHSWEVDLESHLYQLSAASQNLAESISEEGIQGDFFKTALQVRRYTSRAHENILRGTTLKCLRGQLSRIEFHITKLQDQCLFHSPELFMTQVQSLEELAKVVDRDITELELVWGEPSRPVPYWQCESGGYKFAKYFDGYVGRAIDKNLAMKRSLNSCQSSPKFLRRCAVALCEIKNP